FINILLSLLPKLINAELSDDDLAPITVLRIIFVLRKPRPNSPTQYGNKARIADRMLMIGRLINE
ncbi:hypothetical protein, partial [Trichormus variabilis]|uniref:hypothetical protein n=1 Tax=Anabaena variabilis TaxID=264691 RepID=UPI001A92452A